MSQPVAVELHHTAELDSGALCQARALIYDAFSDDVSEEDWEHALGGLHALAWEDGVLVAHGAVVQRRLLHRGRAMRTGYIEAVAVRADRRRRGYGGAVMARLEEVVRAAYELGALGASEMGAPFYAARGWRQWEGETYALTPTGVVRTPEEDEDVYVLEAGVAVDFTAPLVCDWRDGDVW